MLYELQLGGRYLYAGHRERGLIVGFLLSLVVAAIGLGLLLTLGGGNPIGVIMFLVGLISAAVFGLLSLLSVSSAVAVLGVAHYGWLVKKDLTEPILYASVLGTLFALRLWHAWRLQRTLQAQTA